MKAGVETFITDSQWQSWASQSDTVRSPERSEHTHAAFDANAARSSENEAI